jgi:hypothetical protein
MRNMTDTQRETLRDIGHAWMADAGRMPSDSAERWQLAGDAEKLCQLAGPPADYDPGRDCQHCYKRYGH